MPDAQGNLLPGEEGYVAPIIPAAPIAPIEPAEEAIVTPTQEEETVTTPVSDAVPDETVSLEKYNQLLAAYTKLKVRVSLDHVYEKQLDAEAGL